MYKNELLDILYVYLIRLSGLNKPKCILFFKETKRQVSTNWYKSTE